MNPTTTSGKKAGVITQYSNLPEDISKLIHEHVSGTFAYNPCDIAAGLRELGWIATPPRATKASRGGKGRRYYVMRVDGRPRRVIEWQVCKRFGNFYCVAGGMSRTLARRVCAWLNADAGERGEVK